MLPIGIQITYIRFIVRMGYRRTPAQVARIHYLYREELTKLDRYISEAKYLIANDIHTEDELRTRKGMADRDIHLLKNQMQKLYQRSRYHPEQKEMTDAKIRVLTRGVVVRHLLLPGQLIQAKMIVRYLYETYGDRIFISLMSQFTPDHEALTEHFPELDRKVLGREYRSLVDYAAGLGVTNGFMQEGEAASDSFIPAFDDTGV